MVRISEIAFSSYEKAENEHNETLKKYRNDDYLQFIIGTCLFSF